MITWNGDHVPPLAPVARAQGRPTVADLLLEDRKDVGLVWRALAIVAQTTAGIAVLVTHLLLWRQGRDEGIPPTVPSVMTISR